MGEKRARLRYLDGVRALAALYVFAYHALLEVWPAPANFRGAVLLLAGPFRYGRSAVGVFIVLSGYCLMLPVTSRQGYLNRSAGRFFAARFRRIVPTFYAALLLSILLAMALPGRRAGSHGETEGSTVTRWGILSNLLLFQDVFCRGQINRAFWSVAIEWKIYFLFPILVVCFRKSAFVTGVVVALLSFAFFAISRGTVWAGITPQYLILFFLGMVACHISAVARPHPRLNRAFSAGALAVLLAVLYRWRGSFNDLHQLWCDLLVGVWACSLLIFLSQGERGGIRRALGATPLAVVGTMSYSLYLIHAPILQLVWQCAIAPLHVAPLASFLLLIVFGGSVTLLATWLFFIAFERPFVTGRPV